MVAGGLIWEDWEDREWGHWKTHLLTCLMYGVGRSNTNTASWCSHWGGVSVWLGFLIARWTQNCQTPWTEVIWSSDYEYSSEQDGSCISSYLNLHLSIHTWYTLLVETVINLSHTQREKDHRPHISMGEIESIYITPKIPSLCPFVVKPSPHLVTIPIILPFPDCLINAYCPLS